MVIKAIGKNNLCPCGSGKKHEKCCLFNSSIHSDVEWCKIRQNEGSLVDNYLIPYATQDLPEDALRTAFTDFLPSDVPEEMKTDKLFYHFFMPWFLFNWIPFDDFAVEKFEPKKTIAQNYLKLHGEKLNAAEQHFIEMMKKTYYSFYSVLEVEFERKIVIKDILLGTTHAIKEHQGTHHLKRGDVIFSRILTIANNSIFVGMAPFIIPASYHNTLIDFRAWLIVENKKALSPAVLRTKFDLTLFDCFFDIMKVAFNKPLPTVVNTDGEFIQFTKSYFKLTIFPEEALSRLLPLTLSKDPEEFLYDAERDKSGHIMRIDLPWLKKGNKTHKGWDNTFMGQITLENGKLILETNSEKRSERGKKLLSKYLGDAICFQKTLVELPEQKRKSSPMTREQSGVAPEHLESPETQEQIMKMAKAHWENWFDEPIPMLHNITPREAAKTELGREQLNALLLMYERYDLETGSNNLFKADIHYLRSELGLD